MVLLSPFLCYLYRHGKCKHFTLRKERTSTSMVITAGGSVLIAYDERLEIQRVHLNAILKPLRSSVLHPGDLADNPFEISIRPFR